MSTFAQLGLTLLYLLGFALGYWAARDKSPDRRLLAAIVVGVAASSRQRSSVSSVGKRG